jgi:hypothetical protein
MALKLVSVNLFHFPGHTKASPLMNRLWQAQMSCRLYCMRSLQ